jgi:hypothetical protein
VLRFVRAIGVSYSGWEVISACVFIAICVWGVKDALAGKAQPIQRLIERWPLALALGLVIAYFFIPFEYGGAAGLNERVPLFAALLLLPFVPWAPSIRRWFPACFAVFALYMGVQVDRYARRASLARTSALSVALPRGSRVYAVWLQTKLGTLSVDLGRYLLADVARRGDLVSELLFCSHPAHPIRCTTRAPRKYDDSALEDFEKMTASEQREALAQPSSPIRGMFRVIVSRARGSDYLMVLRSTNLDAALDEYVLAPLGATPLDAQSDGPVRTFRLLPHRTVSEFR